MSAFIFPFMAAAVRGRNVEINRILDFLSLFFKEHRDLSTFYYL